MIGTALLRRAKREPWAIYAQGRTNVGEMSPGITWVKFDLCNPKNALAKLPEFDVVFHLAGQTSIYAARDNPKFDLETNAFGFLNLLIHLKQQTLRPFVVFVGTATQVGATESLPINEKHCDHPATFYDISKLTAELYLKQFVSEGWLDGCSLRLANVYGYSREGQSADRGILDKVFRAAIKGEGITIFGDGNYLRDYVFIDDVVSAIVLAPTARERVNGNHFCIGSGQGIALKDAFCKVVDLAAEASGTRAKITHVDPPVELAAIEFRNAIIDASAYSEATGWKPIYDLDAGLRAAFQCHLTSNPTLTRQ